MIKSNIKYIIWIIIFFLIFILFNSWQNEKLINKNIEKKHDNNKTQIENDSYVASEIKRDTNNKELHIETTLVSAKINLKGGNITSLHLKKYNKNLNSNEKIELLNISNSQLYFSQINFRVASVATLHRNRAGAVEDGPPAT